MAAQARDPRGLHAGRAAADDHDAAAVGGRHDLPLELAAGLRVDRAAGALAAAHEVDAGVAGDARPQLVEAALLDLARPVRLGDQRAAEQHEVGVAVGDDLRGELGVVEPPDGDDRHVTAA